MPSSLVELTASIVSSHAVGTEMSGDELIQEINRVFATLKKLESDGVTTEVADTPAAPAMTLKKAFQNDQVGCLVCGKTGFKTLTRHLKQAHGLKPGQYRKQFNIPSSQSLTAKNYSEARRKSANENNLAANLEKARAARAAKNKPVTAKTKTAPVALKAATTLKVTKTAAPVKPVKTEKSAPPKATTTKTIKPVKPVKQVKSKPAKGKA